MTKDELAQFIDQTLLSPTATQKEVSDFCTEAKKCGFKSVCVNPGFVKTAGEILSGSRTKVCTVIDFPLGAGGLESKIFQADNAISEGADELDFVVNLSLVKARQFDALKTELSFLQRSVSEASMFAEDPEGKPKGKIVTKLILETVFLSDEEIAETCRCAKEAGFDFVKTSTGFASVKPNGATVHAVELMKKSAGGLGVKASGGIRSAKEALEFIKAGATRIGTSSGVKILSEFESEFTE